MALASMVYMPVSHGQTGVAVDEQDRYEQLQQSIAALEDKLGYYEPALIEDLVSLAESAIELNLVSEAFSLLDRAIQLQRQNFGLDTSEQIPLYFDLIMLAANAGDWAEVNQSLGYVYWLVAEKQIGSGDSRIENLVRLSELHLLAVAGDDIQERADHFREAEKLTALALQLSEEFWGWSDLRRLDLNYSLIKQLYLQTAALQQSGGETAYALREVVPGVNIVDREKIVKSRYHQAGLWRFNEMQKIAAQSSENPAELLAMIELYRADWQLLFDKEQAGNSYQQAFEALLEAHPQASDLNLLFSRPQTLPVPVFYDSVDRALAAAGFGSAAQQNLAAGDTEEQLHFQDWFNSMPYVPFPVTSPALEQSLATDTTNTLLSFRLNSLENVSRWVRGTYRTHTGVIETFDIVDGPGGADIDLDYLNRRLHFLHFRPTLENGVVRPYEGTLLYSVVMD